MVLKWGDFHLSAEIMKRRFKEQIEGDFYRALRYHASAIGRCCLEDCAQTAIQVMFVLESDSVNPAVVLSIAVGLIMSVYNAQKAFFAIRGAGGAKKNPTRKSYWSNSNTIVRGANTAATI